MRITTNEVALVAMGVALFSTWYSEFRFSQREIFNSKLEAYSNLLTSAEELYEASLIKNAKKSQRFLDASYQMNQALAILDLLAPKKLYEFASEVEDFALLERQNVERNEYFDELQLKMRLDLRRHKPKA